MTGYRVIGTSTDVTDCQRDGCGQTGLKRTIVLRELDIDGNEVEQVYYGSDCAANAAGRTTYTIQEEAAAGDRELAADRENARKMLSHYDPDAPIMENTAKYATANPATFSAYLADGKSVQDFAAHVAGRLAEWAAVLAV